MKELVFLLSLVFAISALAQDCPDSCNIQVPRHVTPDSDEFEAGLLKVYSSCPFNTYQIKIFNRWGEVLFESDDPENHFDAGPREIKDGVYKWEIEAAFCNDQSVLESGFFHVLK